MSNISFSHQFSQQWRGAPIEVKEAIAQELNDIIHLLEEDTDLESFSFTHPDLHDYLDNCYEQAIYDTRYANQVENPTSLTLSQTNASDSLNDLKGFDNTKLDTDNSKTDTNNQISNSSLSAVKAQIIEELEAHIDDYLSEHMTALSDSLRIWLAEEVKNRIDILDNQTT